MRVPHAKTSHERVDKLPQQLHKFVEELHQYEFDNRYLVTTVPFLVIVDTFNILRALLPAKRSTKRINHVDAVLPGTKTLNQLLTTCHHTGPENIPHDQNGIGNRKQGVVPIKFLFLDPLNRA